jgi:GNAT superfamily N-acetyltransferase
MAYVTEQVDGLTFVVEDEDDAEWRMTHTVSILDAEGKSASWGSLAIEGQYAHWDADETQRVPYIWAVETAPEYQRRGYATRIVKRLLQIAAEHGAKTVGLYATEQGRPVYERLGFQVDPNGRIYGWGDVCMFVRLSPQGEDARTPHRSNGYKQGTFNGLTRGTLSANILLSVGRRSPHK